MNARISLGPQPLSAEPLTHFERSCLLRRTCECDELLQLAVLGVEHAQERDDADATLSLIAEFLRDAEFAVRQAKRLAETLQRQI
jgi:hypothetical protein